MRIVHTHAADAARWHGLLPYAVARRQIAYERRHAMVRAWDVGMSAKAVGAWLGLEPATVEGDMRRARHERQRGALSPAERWMANAVTDFCVLVVLARRADEPAPVIRRRA
jgi:hypothetical protein